MADPGNAQRVEWGWVRWWIFIGLFTVLLMGTLIGFTLWNAAVSAREDQRLWTRLETEAVWRQNIDKRMERLLTAIEFASSDTLEELKATVQEIREEIRKEKEDARTSRREGDH